MSACEIDECGRPVRARGWCDKHWQRWRNHGDPRAIKTGRGLPIEQRFLRFVTKTEACWLWSGNGPTSRGYGLFNTNRRQVMAHRFAYELFVGPVPEGLELDHTCEVKNCVNPAHLEPVTRAENMRRISERREQRRTDLAAAHARIADLEEQLRVAHAALSRQSEASSADSRNGRSGSR